MRTTSWALPPNVKTRHVNGYDMAYVEQGTGVPVVFVHGSGVDYRFFAAQMAPFSSRYRAIAVSLRHYYPEPWRGEGTFGLNDHAADLAEFIRQMDAGPVHVVGHSRGGTTALYAAKRIPQLVRTLTFAEGGTGMASFSPDDPELRERRAAAIRTMTDRLSKGDTDGCIEAFVEFASGPGVWQKMPQSFRQWLRDNAWTLTTFGSDPESWEPFSCEDAMRFSFPVLLLGGEQSPAHFAAVLDRLHACMPHAKRVKLPRSGHAMPVVRPDAFNSAVMSFIDAG